MLSDLITLGARWTFVGGKGGTGKTTTAAALALELAGRESDVLILSVDPAHSLGDALETSLGPEPTSLEGFPHLRAMEVDAGHERGRFMARGRADLIRLFEHGTFLDREDIEEFAELSIPGADELAALLRLMELAKHTDSYVIVDLPPTGHSLRLLDLPSRLTGWLDALDAMEAKNRTVAFALVGAYPREDSADLLTELRDDLANVQTLLLDPERTRFVLVTNPQPAVLTETIRLSQSLSRRGIALGGVVINRSDIDTAFTDPYYESLSELTPSVLFVPTLPSNPEGPEGLKAFAGSVSSRQAPHPEPLPSASPLRLGGKFTPPGEARLYLVGGKGGVGKTTTAAALAIGLAQSGTRNVLLVSIDPAGSLGYTLGVEVGTASQPVATVPRLSVQQVDAEGGWRKLRADFLEESDELVDRLITRGQFSQSDRAVLASLIDLAPPGIDELVSLAQVIDLTEDRPYDAIVLDTASTGHFLRFLATPAMALEWTHAVLRLLLKYREVVGLGRLAERVLEISRSIGALRSRLRDPRETWFLAVAAAESLSVPETRRLLAGVHAHGVTPAALLINRLFSPGGAIVAGSNHAATGLLHASRGITSAAAPAMTTPPVGAAELLDFANSWREIVVD